MKASLIFRSTLFFTAAAAVSTLVNVASAGELFPREKTKNVIFIYMAGDNDLESFTIENLKQMSKATGINSERLRVVVQFDRGLKHDESVLEQVANGIGGERVTLKHTGTTRILVEDGKFTNLGLNDTDDEKLDKPGTDPNTSTNLNTTESKTLADFISWGMKRFPNAERYMLSFWDHGTAWKGCCVDETSNSADPHKSLTVPDIAKGIDDGLRAANKMNFKFNIIGFDTCLMAHYTTLRAIAPFANTVVASEELEPGEGWDYSKWMSDVAAGTNLDDVDNGVSKVGKSIADAFKANVDNQSKTETFTLSVIDTSAMNMAALKKAVEEFAQAAEPIAKGKDQWQPFGAARAKSSEFGESGKANFEVIDLGQFTTELKALTGDPGTKANNVVTAINQMVKYKVAGPTHKDALGISIYVPSKDYNAKYADASLMDPWTPFAQAYAAGAGSDTAAPVVTVDQPTTPTEDAGTTNPGDETGTSSDDAAPTENDAGTSDDAGPPLPPLKEGEIRFKIAAPQNDIDQVVRVAAIDHTPQQLGLNLGSIKPDENGNVLVYYGEIPTTEGGGGAQGKPSPVIVNSKDRAWPVLTDGKTEIPASLLAVSTGQGNAKSIVAVGTYFSEKDVNGQPDFQPKSQDANGNLYVIFFQVDKDKNGQIVDIYQVDPAGAVNWRTPEAKIQPVQFVLDASKGDKGDFVPVKSDKVLNAKDLKLVSKELPAPSANGKTWMGVTATDYATNKSEVTLAAIANSIPPRTPDNKSCSCTTVSSNTSGNTMYTMLAGMFGVAVMARRVIRRSKK